MKELFLVGGRRKEGVRGALAPAAAFLTGSRERVSVCEE